ncbi:MAG: hypothetical protein ACR2GF_04245 [Acidimicrobiales bacterium]
MGSREAALAVFARVCRDGSIDQRGNARFVRNLYDKLAESRALRHEGAHHESLTRAQVSEILPEDVEYAAAALLGEKHRR